MLWWQCSETMLQKCFEGAVTRAGMIKHVSVHTVRHTFATHLPASCTGIQTIQLPLGQEKSRVDVRMQITQKMWLAVTGLFC